jgi:hypothetical protein
MPSFNISKSPKILNIKMIIFSITFTLLFLRFLYLYSINQTTLFDTQNHRNFVTRHSQLKRIQQNTDSTVFEHFNKQINVKNDVNKENAKKIDEKHHTFDSDDGNSFSENKQNHIQTNNKENKDENDWLSENDTAFLDLQKPDLLPLNGILTFDYFNL